MQVRLEGKVAVVTGVSGDGQVGQVVAKALAVRCLVLKSRLTLAVTSTSLTRYCTSSKSGSFRLRSK
jgi:hypothetical protein